MKRKLFRVLRNEEGIALVTALILGLLGMLMVATLLTMVQTGTWFMGSKKRYQMTLDASHGSLDFFAKEIIDRGIGGQNLSNMAGGYNGLFIADISDANMNTKLTTSGMLGAGAYPADGSDIISTIALPSGPVVTVTTGLTSTSRGNSGTSGNLVEGGGVVNNTSGSIEPMHIPYIYQIETQGTGPGNENARLSAIYAF